MATLSAAELISIRYITGALDTTIWTDAILQADYDLSLINASDVEYIMPYTYVYVLRKLWGWQRAQQDRNTTNGDRQPRSQISERTKELLDYWEGQAGLSGGGVLSSGVISLGIDQDEETA